jgi:predicted DCC family thiol-disulfide oxidoreductase YuxK
MTRARLYYDGACGFCSRWVPWIGRLIAEHGVDAIPAFGLPQLRAVDARGRIHEGADAYRFLFRKIPWGGAFTLLAETPLLRRCFDAAYAAFARNRYFISTTCGLRPTPRG